MCGVWNSCACTMMSGAASECIDPACVLNMCCLDIVHSASMSAPGLAGPHHVSAQDLDTDNCCSVGHLGLTFLCCTFELTCRAVSRTHRHQHCTCFWLAVQTTWPCCASNALRQCPLLFHTCSHLAGMTPTSWCKRMPGGDRLTGFTRRTCFH